MITLTLEVTQAASAEFWKTGVSPAVWVFVVSSVSGCYGLVDPKTSLSHLQGPNKYDQKASLKSVLVDSPLGNLPLLAFL